MDTANAKGEFRQDLYYRISEVSVKVPPLRERDADGVVLAEHFLQVAAKRHGRTGLRFGIRALQAIQGYGWPGNIRELENRVNRAAIMAEGREVTIEDLGFEPGAEKPLDFLNLREVRQRAELGAVRGALAISGGNVSRAAELLGITRPTLYDLMERAGLRPSPAE
jgi:two-component system NtrC family response regulator